MYDRSNHRVRMTVVLSAASLRVRQMRARHDWGRRPVGVVPPNSQARIADWWRERRMAFKRSRVRLPSAPLVLQAIIGSREAGADTSPGARLRKDRGLAGLARPPLMQPAGPVS